MTDVVLVLTTVPAGDLGETLAQTLVEERLAACVNLIGPVTSVYQWHNAVEREIERQVVIKTTRERLPALQARVGELHPYELPEFIVVAVAEGSPGYLEWVQRETRSR